MYVGMAYLPVSVIADAFGAAAAPVLVVKMLRPAGPDRSIFAVMIACFA
jgi:hypothetical protein